MVATGGSGGKATPFSMVMNYVDDLPAIDRPFLA